MADGKIVDARVAGEFMSTRAADLQPTPERCARQASCAAGQGQGGRWFWTLFARFLPMEYLELT